MKSARRRSAAHRKRTYVEIQEATVQNQPYLVFAAQVVTAKFLDTFKEFPPRQRAASFSIDQAVEKMKQSLSSE
jgi:hypothetical protein